MTRESPGWGIIRKSVVKPRMLPYTPTVGRPAAQGMAVGCLGLVLSRIVSDCLVSSNLVMIPVGHDGRRCGVSVRWPGMLPAVPNRTRLGGLGCFDLT